MNASAKKRTRSQMTELRKALSSLAKLCPADRSNIEDCPLHNVRKLNQSQRVKWINTLNDDDLAYLAAYHHICMDVKLALKAFKIASSSQPGLD